MLGIKHDGHSDCSSVLLPNIRSLAASGRIYNPINSDQLYETQSSILEINRVLTIEEPFVNKRGFVSILIQLPYSAIVPFLTDC
jgi:hypothetical protein